MDTVEIVATAVAAVVSLVSLIFGAPALGKGARMAAKAIKVARRVEDAAKGNSEPAKAVPVRKPKG